jgi:hypothetical protein
MKTKTPGLASGLLIAICMSFASFVANAQSLLGSSSTGSSPASIYSIDSSTGTATLIGPSGLLDSQGGPNKISSLALDPMSGRFYGIFGSSCTGARLITIDPLTGAGTIIGPLVGAGFDATDDTGSGSTGTGPCLGGSDALIFGDDGTLYASGWNAGFTCGTFLTLDKTTGAVLSAVPTDFNAAFGCNASISGMARAPDGTLWASRGNNAEGVLNTVDPLTGGFTSTLVLSDPTTRLSDIAFSDAGTLYASRPNTGMLVSIDTVTGAVTNIGPFGGGAKISGLSPRAAEVPADECADPSGCNPTGGLIVEIPPSVPIPPGTTIAQTADTYHDPRPGMGKCGKETLVLFDDDPSKPDLIIPWYLCGDPFVVVETETDLEILNDTVVLQNEPDAFFDDPLECNDPIPSGTDPQLQDAVVWQGTDEAPEDDGFATEKTFECGSSRGRSRGFSYNVVGMSINFGLDWNTQPHLVRQKFVDLGLSKYQRLFRAVYQAKPALPNWKWKKFLLLTAYAGVAYHWGWYEYANQKLEILLYKVEETTFDTGSGYNHKGNIASKTDNLLYYTDKFVIGLEDPYTY